MWIHCPCKNLADCRARFASEPSTPLGGGLAKTLLRVPFSQSLNHCPALESILDLAKVGDEILSLEKFGTDNETAKLRAGFWILDIGSSARFTSIPKKRLCPCLTRSRCKNRGYYVPRLSRRVSVKELAHLQGVPETIYQRMLKKLLTEHASDKKWTETRCENEVAAAFGDGMSVNVLQRVSLSLNPVAVCWEPAVKLSLPKSRVVSGTS